MKKKEIVLVWDFDLTLSNEYQQVPLFTKNLEQIKKTAQNEGLTIKDPLDYFLRCDKLQGELGISYMQRMIWDAQPQGCLENLTTKDLFNYGKLVTPAKNIKNGLKELKKEFNKNANIHHYIISVGIKDMIEGFVKENELEEIIEGINASEFQTNENSIINGIKRAIVPFNKNQPLIEIMKGNPELLNQALEPAQYKYNYKDLVVIGDGFSDISKFAFSKKKGATPVCVYSANNYKEYHKALENVSEWVDYILPRDYSPNKKTIDTLKEIIENKIKRNCEYSPESLYNYNKGKITHPQEQKCIEEHLKTCQECNNYYQKKIITPNNITKISSSKFQ